jgi:hypothetical protein
MPPLTAFEPDIGLEPRWEGGESPRSNDPRRCPQKPGTRRAESASRRDSPVQCRRGERETR